MIENTGPVREVVTALPQDWVWLKTAENFCLTAGVEPHHLQQLLGYMYRGEVNVLETELVAAGRWRNNIKGDINQ